MAEATAAAVRAACPNGHLAVDLRAECGRLEHAQLVAALDPPEGRPVDVAPWRVALVVVRQDSEGRTDRQAAAAVRRGREWTEA
jgi:transposase